MLLLTYRRLAYVLSFIAMAALPCSAALVTNTFGGSVWPRTDAEIGVTGFVIEDFEDLALAPGLRIGLVSNPLSATLPNAFNPATDDSAGTVFTGGVWDGSRSVLNQGPNDVPACGYNCGGWGDILIEIAAGTTSIGFSLQQLDSGLALFANGSATSFGTVVLPVAGSSRNGYVRIDATAGDTLQTLLLRPTNSADGFSIDHLAFAQASPAPIPEPNLAGVALVALAVMLATKANAVKRSRSAS